MIDAHQHFWRFSPESHATTYQEWLDTVGDWLAPLSTTERERILGETAIEAYRL